ncbi:MAG: hypothetical protein A3J76_01205 [Candidatus Moranbacteria bacterium RBG_13_45_13]|nr:MAG: hypothetical protein A3J76_01205 [Candidatus Moranbacteria bacterium RBG_13_45_13]
MRVNRRCAMRKETQEKDGCTYYLRFFRDWLDFVSCAEHVLRGCKGKSFGGMECSSLYEGKRDWYGTETLAEAVEFAYRGWPEGRKKIREARERMQIEKLLPRAQRIIRSVDTSGDEPDIDLFLQGEPEHMVTLHETIKPHRGKVLRFVLSRDGNASVEGLQMIRRGTAVLTALETLLMLGFTVEILIVLGYERRSAEGAHYVPILHAGDPINLDTLAFMFLQPAVLRRLSFAACECESREYREIFDIYANGGYSRACLPTFLPEHDFCLDWKDGLLNHDDEVVPFAFEILRRVGIKIPETV